MIEINFPKLHPRQIDVANSAARFKVCAAGRRFGKSRLGSALCVADGMRGKRAWWVAPSYPVATVGWRMVKKLSLGIPGINIKLSEHTIEYPGGGEVRVRSADNPDSLRGDGLNFVVLDECAFMKEETWTEALRPALSDREGGALFISTPRGRGWFWKLWQKGKDGTPGWESWQLPTSANPHIDPKEIEAARLDMPDVIFRQEYLAEFVDLEGAVFRRVQDATIEGYTDPMDNRQYIAGVDVAASVDFTVITVWDAGNKQMVYMDRFNRVDYPALEDRLHACYNRWNMTAMTIEANSIGQGVIDHLAARGMNIIPFTTTSATKQAIIQNLQSAFEHGLIQIANYPVLVGELLSFEAKRSPSGSFTYSAPEGLHDDCVMSLAIGWNSLSNTITGSLVF